MQEVFINEPTASAREIAKPVPAMEVISSAARPAGALPTAKHVLLAQPLDPEPGSAQRARSPADGRPSGDALEVKSVFAREMHHVPEAHVRDQTNGAFVCTEGRWEKKRALREAGRELLSEHVSAGRAAS